MRRMRWSAIALTLALAMVAAACGGTEGTTEPVSGEEPAGETTTIDVSLTDFAIDPAHIEAPEGSPLSFNVSNDGEAPHTFGVLVGGETYETVELQAGETATLDVPALEAGEYETLCTVPGHDTLGMTGMLMIGDAGSGDGTDSASGGHANMTAEEMAKGHEQGVLDFVGQLENGPLTKVNGNLPMEPEMDGDVKVYNLTVDEMEWEVAPGQVKEGMAFNGQIPGPQITVQQGDMVRIVVQNQLEEPFALHLHGNTLANNMDGVPYVTQPAIMPGEYWEYEIEIVDPPGMYVYHSHFNSAEQVGKGLYGAFNVQPKTGGWKSVYGVEPAVEYSMFLGDGPLGYNLNGKSFPATEPIVAEQGEWVLIHMANDGAQLHPMHLHGFHFMVVGEDGFPLTEENRYMADTLVVAPGSRYDILVKADYPGAWAFHCHILTHAEGPEGMFGMVTALVVV
jgi:manganese oxidase